MPGPALVLVEGSILRSGRGSMLGPDTSRRTHWWELRLACGHTVERTARYRPLHRGHQYQRSKDDVLPAPARARCEYCRSSRRTGGPA